MEPSESPLPQSQSSSYSPNPASGSNGKVGWKREKKREEAEVNSGGKKRCFRCKHIPGYIHQDGNLLELHPSDTLFPCILCVQCPLCNPIQKTGYIPRGSEKKPVVTPGFIPVAYEECKFCHGSGRVYPPLERWSAIKYSDPMRREELRAMRRRWGGADLPVQYRNRSLCLDRSFGVRRIPLECFKCMGIGAGQQKEGKEVKESKEAEESMRYARKNDVPSRKSEVPSGRSKAERDSRAERD